MATDYTRAMDALTKARTRQNNQRLGPMSTAPSFGRGGASPIQMPTFQAQAPSGPSAMEAALRALPQPEPEAPKPFGAGIPIVGGLIEHTSQGESFGDRARLGLDWLLNEYKPTGALMRTLGTTGALTAGAINEIVSPEKTPGEGILDAAGQNVRNLWSWDRDRSEPVRYNQDWIQDLRERQTGRTPDERTGFDRATDFVGGFALDVLTDPLSFLGAGAINRVGQAGNRAIGAGAKAVGAREVSERAFQRASQLKATREGFGPALRHQSRGPFRERSPIKEAMARSVDTPIVPGTRQATNVAQEAAEDVATAKQVIDTGTPQPSVDIPNPASANRPHTNTPLEDARDASVFGDAQPGRLSPETLRQANQAVQDPLDELFDIITPRSATARSNAATPQKMRADTPDIPNPFRSFDQSVGRFETPSLLDDIPPSVSAREWVTEMTPQQMEAMPTFRLFEKRPYSFPTIVRIANGDFNFGTAATRGPRNVRLTREEIAQAQPEAQRIINQAHQEAVGASRAARQAPEGGQVPSAPESAPRPPGRTDSATSATPSRARATAWEPVASLGGDWERISARDWSNLQKRLKRMRNSGRLTSREYSELLRARRENDPALWQRTVDEIMYDGYPSPINVQMREMAENFGNADEIAEAAAQSVGKGSPEMRMINDPANFVQEGRAVRNAIHKTLTEEFINKPRTHRVPTKTAARITRDAPDDITVTGRYPDEFGRYSQYTAQKNLFQEIDINNSRFWRREDGTRVPFMEQGKARYDYAMPHLKAMMESLELQGIIPNTAVDMRGFPMNIHDVLEILPEADAINMFFHPGKLVPTTNILEAAELLVRHTNNGGTVESIRGTVETLLKQTPGTRGGGVNKFANAADMTGDGATNRLNAYRRLNRKPKNFTFEQMVNEEAAHYAQALIQRRPAIVNKAAEKSARYSAEVNAEFASIASDTIENALRNIEEGRFMVQVQTVENLDDITRLNGHRIGAKTESIDRAVDSVEEAIARNIPPEKLARLNDDARLMNAAETQDAAAFNRTAQEVSDDAVARAQQNAPAAALNDHDASNDMALMARVESKYGSLGDKFKKNFGMEDIGDALHTMNAVARPMRAAYTNRLNQVTKKFGEAVGDGDTRTLFNAAFDEIRLGKAADQIANPRIREAASEVEELVDFFFPVRQGEELANRFVGRFNNPELINAAFSARGYDHVRFDMAAARTAAKNAGDESQEAVMRHLSNQWREWTISDPSEFLSVAEDVLNKMATNDAAMRQGVHLLNKLGATSKAPKPGFVKLPAGGKDDLVRFTDYLGDANLYVHEAAAEQIVMMQRVLNQSLEYTSDLGKWTQRNVLPIMNMWKTGMTIWNARHWIRNFWGDVGLNMLAGHNSPSDYFRAMRMMHAKSTYDSMWDGADALRRAGTELRGRPPRNPNVKGSDPIVTSRNGISFTADDINTFSRDNGVFISFPVRYDLIDDMVDPSRMQQFTGHFEFTGGRAKQLVSSGHEWRDHMVRGSHMIAVLRKGKWKNKQQALEEAAKIVRKWHPDGSDLQHWESKYARIAAPFYSWTRRALPLVFEAMVSNPHRIMSFPKAYYNAAEAMGVNLHSIADPFPTDQLFPDYLTDRIVGPAYQDAEGNYWGGHPGLPFDDLSQFLNDPIGEAIGMGSPALKVPIELLTGQRIGSGAIRDTSDYIDSNIPFINTISNFLGVSVTGTAANVLTGNAFNTDSEGRTIDTQANVDRELKEHFDMTTALNWLTGAQLQNMSRPNVITRAEFEERDRVEQMEGLLGWGRARRER